MPFVSVIIPVFNRGESLARAVQSVMEQSFTDFELIVVDDGSTEEVKPYFRDFSDKLKYIRIPHRGVSTARNVGIENSTGEWITFLDSDDVWLPEKLEKQIAYSLHNPQFLIHQTDEKWLKNGREIYPKKKHTKCAGDIFRYCLPLCIVSPSAVMVHKSVFNEIGKFDEFLPACEDYDFWLRVSLRYEFGLLAEKLIIKTGGHPDQLSERYWGMDRFRLIALKKLLTLKLEKSRRVLVIEEIITKLKILSQGRQKRQGKNIYQQQLSYYEKLLEDAAGTKKHIP